MKTIEPTVFTWGYSKRTLEDLILLVNRNDIRHVIDCRARPNSRWRPDFSRGPLQRAFAAAYIWAECFGNAKKDKPNEWVVQSAGDAGEAFAGSFADVIESGMLGNVLLLCLEQDPAKCHRSAVAEFIGCKTVHLGVPEVPQA